MIYLSDEQLDTLNISWNQIIEALEQATELFQKNDYVQPVKPYLRYKNLQNRIIAMPSYLGGNINKAGIKWIASFPGNLDRGIPRAHAVTILNNADTGVPMCIINSIKTSIFRTSGVSGVIIKQYLKLRDRNKRLYNVGIVGFGPIGKAHLKMLCELHFDIIDHIKIYDIRAVDLSGISEKYRHKIFIYKNWKDVYTNTDIFITCTVSKERYISVVPKPGSLHLNISLRDYYPETMQYMNKIIVDDWDEVNRENTDIHNMRLRIGLKKESVTSLKDTPLNDIITNLKETDTVMFNPMGLSVFDIAIANLFYNKALLNGVAPLS
jgi:2,3-diaminopropionate biosynthesis protein SbnB